MDRPAPNPPRQRDLVFCHQCEDEWYRDEHGLQCPHCHSDFTEIVEAGHDPREEEMHIPADPQHPLHDHNPWQNAPDPDEDDIDHFQWQRGQPGQQGGNTYHATFNRTYDVNLGGRGQVQGQGGGGGGLLGMLGNMVGGMVNNALQSPGPQHQQRQYTDAESGMRVQGAPGSAPGSPRGEQPRGPPGGTRTQHYHGPGYSFTMTTSSNLGGNLHPRNAHQPQPFNAQPDQMDNVMRQLFQNIGAFPGQRGPPGFGPHDDMHGGMPFPGALFQQLLGGQHGDAVYSQEALDRIVTQLMEQHQTGNAPGPASRAAIDSLPKRGINEQDLGEQGKAECSICMADVDLGEEVTVLPCMHWFHDECVRHWLNEHDTCPHCRQGIMPKENDQSRAAQQARSPSQAPLNDHGSPGYLRTNIPGAFPFPQSGAGAPGPSTTGGSGARHSPFTVPESPSLGRGSSAQQGSGGTNQGVFNRMRDAFGGGSGSGSRS